MTKKKPLTDKQKRFIDEYMVDNNATQAAIRAGYSEKTARTQGSLNMTNVDIQAEIRSRQEALKKSSNIRLKIGHVMSWSLKTAQWRRSSLKTRAVM